MKKILVVVIFVVLVIVVIASALLGPRIESSSVKDNEVRIPLQEISEKAKWYDYELNNVKIRFFAVKADDGSIKTAFDACDICYRFKKGYKQEGNYMVCNNCGRRFPISSLGTENKNPGGCWPGYLPGFVDKENLVIKRLDLENGKWRFT